MKDYFEEQTSDQSHEPKWKILGHAINEVVSVINICLKSQQGYNTLVVEKNDTLAMSSAELQTL